MSEKHLTRAIVFRQKTVRGRHEGSAWKIAYADFVTAMMAFFLLMWVSGIFDAPDKGQIAEYFKRPLKLVFNGNYAGGQSALVTKGGGRDMTLSNQQETDGAKLRPAETRNMKNAKDILEQEELNKMRVIKQELDHLINTSEKTKPYRNQLTTDISRAGLRLQILDEKKRPMFALSRAELEPQTREILKELAPVLSQMQNRISISGHTDAKPFTHENSGYSNWELSADRALEARRVLLEGGMDESRILRVIGLSSSVLLEMDDPYSPANRRISIILLTKEAEEGALSEGLKGGLTPEQIEAKFMDEPDPIQSLAGSAQTAQ